MNRPGILFAYRTIQAIFVAYLLHKGRFNAFIVPVGIWHGFCKVSFIGMALALAKILQTPSKKNSIALYIYNIID